MTIAMCYVSPEGVVLGADSTATQTLEDGWRFYNNAQKVFEIGEDGTLGLVTWGLGDLGDVGYRTLVARFVDDLERQRPSTVAEVAERWGAHFGHAYRNSAFVRRFRELAAKPPLGALPATRPPVARTAAEEYEFEELSNSLTVGFCIGGYVKNREPVAFEIVFRPNRPEPVLDRIENHRTFAVSNFSERLLYGIEENTFQKILNSGKWTGDAYELIGVFSDGFLNPKALPIREAIDFVHFCVSSTIKALKFSGLPQTCGGPIEIAVITTDRKFRWVSHKPWHSAITEGDRDGR